MVSRANIVNEPPLDEPPPKRGGYYRLGGIIYPMARPHESVGVKKSTGRRPERSWVSGAPAVLKVAVILSGVMVLQFRFEAN
jgi:hypothetical protein